MNIFTKYAKWLHTQWPAGRPEKLPAVNEDGSTNVRGLYVAGDLRGIPLLKYAADSGARVVESIVADSTFQSRRKDGDPEIDIAIIGGGVAGMAAALQARKHGLNFRVFESNEPFATVVNFPRNKPIFTYPEGMIPAGELTVSADIKEALVEELKGQSADIEVVGADVSHVRKIEGGFAIESSKGEIARARRVVCALGRSGNYRRLNVPGEDLGHVYNRLHDPHDFCEQRVTVVGGGDSALETAVAVARCGADTTLCYRGREFSRPRRENVKMLEELTSDSNAPGRIRVLREATVREIRPGEVSVETGGQSSTVPGDVVFSMIGREPALDFFRRSGVHISGEWDTQKTIGLTLFVLFCTALYNWKSGGFLSNLTYQHHLWPVSMKDDFSAVLSNPNSLVSVLVTSAATPSFWYTLAYSLLVTIFGVMRIRRRKTPYVRVQTYTLMFIQVFFLFLFPEIILPWLGKNAMLPQGLLDALFPAVEYGNGREYWRAYGLILAWPLNVYNVFTQQPLGWWLVIAFVQTFVAIPVLVYYWGKGAYCGWICSCGALAETLGDTHRTKMPHGPATNRLNMFGQAVLAVAVILLALRIAGWTMGNNAYALNQWFPGALNHYKWTVDVFLAGIVGYGFYFWFSGRVWCRFMCPLAALMHIYARFSRYAIVSDKKKCISCNVCTTVCHQGIDVMNFANKGRAMTDPECVRCSACVHSCPTQVLSFGQIDRNGATTKIDRLSATSD